MYQAIVLLPLIGAIIAGIILLISMIGAIVLTLRQREGVRRQSIPRQIARRREEAVENRKVPTRTGI